MRILFLAHRLPYPPNKGDRIRSFRELQLLSERHEVDLFCFYDKPEDEQQVENVKRYCRYSYGERLGWLSSRFRSLAALFKGQPFSMAYFHSWTMEEVLRKAIHSERYDLVFMFSSSMATYSQVTGHLPVILDMVDVDSDKWAQYAKQSSPLLSWLWAREARLLSDCETEMVERSVATLLCTDAEAAILKKRGPAQKIRVVGNALDMDYFDRDSVQISGEIASWQPYIIFTGAMDYRPNVDAVTYFCREVFPIIRKSLPELKFVIAGMNPSREVVELAGDDAVRVTGLVSDIRPYLKGAVAAVAPMRIARGIQNKILEALAMGLPVITTCKVAGGFPKSVASLVAVGDLSQEFAAAVLDAVQDGPKHAAVQVRDALAEHYSPAELRSRLEQLVSEAVSGKFSGQAKQRIDHPVLTSTGRQVR